MEYASNEEIIEVLEKAKMFLWDGKAPNGMGLIHYVPDTLLNGRYNQVCKCVSKARVKPINELYGTISKILMGAGDIPVFLWRAGIEVDSTIDTQAYRLTFINNLIKLYKAGVPLESVSNFDMVTNPNYLR